MYPYIAIQKYRHTIWISNYYSKHLRYPCYCLICTLLLLTIIIIVVVVNSFEHYSLLTSELYIIFNSLFSTTQIHIKIDCVGYQLLKDLKEKTLALMNRYKALNPTYNTLLRLRGADKGLVLLCVTSAGSQLVTIKIWNASSLHPKPAN